MFPPIPGGADGRSRLLPWSVPLRFFAAAGAFHLAAWFLLLDLPESVPYFRLGLGAPLAALHAITIGTLLMVLIGASLQLLPIATLQAVAAVRLARLLWWVLTPGAALLVAGMATGNLDWLRIGASAVSIGGAIFAVLLGLNLVRAPWRQDTIWHGLVGWLALLALGVTGAALVWHYTGPGLSVWRAVVLVHIVTGIYGLMTVLAMGFGYLLIPMFAVARQPGNAVRRGCLGLALAGVLVACGGSFRADGTGWIVAGAGLGLSAALVHVGAMAREVSRRMRPILGPWFWLVALGWALLPVSLVIGILALLKVGGPHMPTLFGFIAVVGWLLSFVLGVLAQIVPFLASVHAMGASGVPPLVSRLTPLAALRIHRVCHVVALVTLAGAIAFDSPQAVRVGAGVGIIGALCFLGFLAGVQRRMGQAMLPTSTERLR